MNKRTKIALYVLLALSACLFIWRFQSNYARLMKEGETKTDSDLINVKVPDYQRLAAPARTDYHLGGWGAGMVLSLVGRSEERRVGKEGRSRWAMWRGTR